MIAAMSGSESCLPYGGIFPLPPEMTFVSSRSVCFWTASERRSRTFRLYPRGVPPLPSGPWHVAHFAL